MDQQTSGIARCVFADERGLFADDRGTATIEYLIILVCVTIGVAFALIAMGPAVVEVFRARVFWLSLPFP